MLYEKGSLKHCLNWLKAKSALLTAWRPSLPMMPTPMSAAWIMATSFAPSPIASMRLLMLLREFWTLRSTVLGSSSHLAIGCLFRPLCGPCFSCAQHYAVSTRYIYDLHTCHDVGCKIQAWEAGLCKGQA